MYLYNFLIPCRQEKPTHELLLLYYNLKYQLEKLLCCHSDPYPHKPVIF